MEQSRGRDGLTDCARTLPKQHRWSAGGAGWSGAFDLCTAIGPIAAVATCENKAQPQSPQGVRR